MLRKMFALGVLVALVSVGVARAEQDPTVTGPLSPSEKAFVVAIQTDLNARFATPADAVKAGYFRYSNVDDTGAISYANLQWESQDIKHPSQLWYDADGHLLGADYSVAFGAVRPHLFGVNPGRWSEFGAHVHWVTRDADGKYKYEQATSIAKFVKAGGDPNHPTAATVVALGKAASASDVVTVFEFPHIWDLTVWVKPNPAGAFADKNPLVKM